MIKALFFDIDGTLVSFNTHKIPASAIEALTAAKARGIKIFISTGRPYALINNIGDITHLVDGYITANGAYCFCGDTIISCTPISPADVTTLARKADEMNFSSIMVGTHNLSMYNPLPEATGIFAELLDINGIDALPLNQMISQPILQLTPIITEEQEKEILPLLENVTSSRWYPAFTDITARGVNKAKGLMEMASWFGFDISETMAFGDGGNDIAIIEAAGTGIAMGNAGDNVKSVADYITTSVDDNGIHNALRHFHVI